MSIYISENAIATPKIAY